MTKTKTNYAQYMRRIKPDSGCTCTDQQQLREDPEGDYTFLINGFLTQMRKYFELGDHTTGAKREDARRNAIADLTGSARDSAMAEDFVMFCEGIDFALNYGADKDGR